MQVVDIAQWAATRRTPPIKPADGRDRPTLAAIARRLAKRDGATVLPDAADPIARRHRPE